MLGGVTGGTTGSLRVRKLTSGDLQVDNAPGTHEFPREWILRELNEAVCLYVVLPSDPPVTYLVTEIAEGPKGWDLRGALKSEAPVNPAPRRRWWQRKKNG